ncbi:hypothetical protein B5F12_01085 [Pseudoflavonifractor sp. An176]|uniref:hypothetical protein n=1 Tax=Pseudoflavonifractor sp. An176 TaxID=1965572 RepID=UPI000B37AC96|nr:hypothetical protein [Pseudoflavonifractor sp. An176]OUP66144.1 hypothetical protein B5F12_01085 [Pseudoflavonifractor sp. An176]
MKLRRYGWYVAIGVVCGGLLSLSRINPYDGQITLQDLVLQLSGSRGDFVMELYYGAMVDFGFLMLPFFLYQFYGGIQLYCQFCVASVYVFSRTTNRVKWYFTELWGMCKGLVVLQVFLQGTTLLVAALRWEVMWTTEGWVLLGIHVLLFTLWTLTMALGVNLLSLIWGSSAGFLVVFALQAGMLAALCTGAKLEPADPALGRLLFLDPISRLVMGWQSGGAFGLEGDLPAEYGHVLTLSGSLLLVALMTAAVLVLGLVAIQKKDILVSNLETGGV